MTCTNQWVYKFSYLLTYSYLELKDALQRIWTVLLQKSIVKDVKYFSKQLEASVSAHWSYW